MSNNPHTITDHALGSHHDHDHGHGSFDHDHDHDFMTETDTPKAVSFVSVGLDIGSSSTQVAFSELKMRGPGRQGVSPEKFDRRTLFLSPISPTPYGEDGTIDETRLRRIVDTAFEAAKLTPDDIETGVVILTGEAAARANATSIAHLVSETAGELVCAAAGHHMEAMLSAHGSGAVEASRQGAGQRIIVVDIGGSTTKLALVDNGRVVKTAALAAGGRLLVIDRDNRIKRLDSAGDYYAKRAGFSWNLGAVIDPAHRDAMAEKIADVITAAVSGQAARTDIAPLFLTSPLDDIGDIDGVMVAGGVGEYVYDRETRDFNDLGRALGLSLRRRINNGIFPYILLPPGECIRATVLGASEYSLQLSGSTIFISSHADLLPCRNVPVIRPAIELDQEIIVPGRVTSAIERHIAGFDFANPSQPLALSLSWSGVPAYERVRALAEGISRGFASRIDEGTPVYILVDGDVALSLGNILKEELHLASEVMVIDGIQTGDFDFVDMGRMRLPSHTVPVTIKSLIFGRHQG